MLKISNSIEKLNTGHTEVKQTEPYIIFTVNNEEFGIESLKVLELVNYMVPLKMPNNYDDAQGVTSYRGKIIPIIDLRMIFGLDPIPYDDNTVTIVVESGCVFGVTAERVLDLVFIPLTSIKRVSAFNFGEKTRYLKSVANFGDRLVLLLDPDKMVETETAQRILKEPDPFVSLTEDQGSNLIEGNSKDYGSVEVTPKLIIATGDVEESSPMKPPVTSQVGRSSAADYLINHNELEELLKGITNPGQEEEASLGNELESNESELPENTSNQEYQLNVAEDLFQMETTVEIENNSNQTEALLSDEVIEDLIKELEAKSQPDSNKPLSDDGLQNSKADQLKALKERWDV